MTDSELALQKRVEALEKQLALFDSTLQGWEKERDEFQKWGTQATASIGHLRSELPLIHCRLDALRQGFQICINSLLAIVGTSIGQMDPEVLTFEQLAGLLPKRMAKLRAICEAHESMVGGDDDSRGHEATSGAAEGCGGTGRDPQMGNDDDARAE